MPENESSTTASKKIEIRLTLRQVWAVVVVVVAVVSGAFSLGWSVSSWLSGGNVAISKTEVEGIKRELGDLKSEYDSVTVDREKLRTKEAVLRLFYFYHLAKVDEEVARCKVEVAQIALDGLLPFSRPSILPAAFVPPEVRAAAEKMKADYERKYLEYYESLAEKERNKIDDAQTDLVKAKAELSKATNATFEAGQGFFALVHQEDERARHLDITLAHISKGGSGIGTIKFTYDDMTVHIPNEFLPKVAE